MKNQIQAEFLFREESYINGEWKSGNETFSVENPFTGEVLARVADLGADDTRRAIDSAAAAFKIWSKYSANKRARILQNWRSLQLEHAKDLAHILTCEQGKSLVEAIGEIKYGASYVEWFAEEAKRVYGDVIPSNDTSKRITVIKQPIGVVGAITPWNFPSAMITRKVSPALAAGCTVVLKPSELTPLSAIALAVLAEKAGIPPGVFNVITSSKSAEIGEELTSNPLVRKLSFTGSTAVGKLLLRQSASTVKRVSMELGGNAPFIVFSDADVDLAVKEIIASKFRNSGQTCVCTNRIFVHEERKEEFVEKFKKAIDELKVGNGLDEGVNVGVLVEKKAADSVRAVIADAESKGAKVYSAECELEHELLVPPTILENATEDMDVFSNEIFGPVAPVFTFTEEAEVLEMANNTRFGLAAYFFGKDYSQIWRVAEALEYGMVGINTGVLSSVMAPFGGVKESGFGREGSKYGIDDYLNIKYMCWAGV